MRLRVSVRKQDLMIPLVVVLNALMPDLYDQGNFSHAISTGTPRDEGFLPNQSSTKANPLALLGTMCASLFRQNLPEDADDDVFGLFFLERYIAVHVNSWSAKQDVLALMSRKLHSFVHAKCCEDNMDSVSHQELLMPGHILSAYIREKMEDTLGQSIAHMRRDAKNDLTHSSLNIHQNILPYCSKILGRYVGVVGSKISSFIASGNLISSSGLDLQQTTGFAIVAERLNKWRYLSHFRSVHRGQFFTTMKTTSVRKLLPEAWGFLCPVHTPDGAPCGLLSHISAKTHVVCNSSNMAANTKNWRILLIDILISLGMLPTRTLSLGYGAKNGRANSTGCTTSWKCMSDHLHVCLDGFVLGSAPDEVCANISWVLRRLKVKAFSAIGIDTTLEIAHVKQQGLSASCPFSGLYLFSQPARLVRPVLQCGLTAQIELIGPFEQSTLQISCTKSGLSLPEDNISTIVTETHAEIDPTVMLSFLASLTPFSDFNQSPRNMYQCQMGKQTMGTPSHSFYHRGDHKMYRLLTPQSPLVCTRDYHNLTLDLNAQGTNSIVAVVSYTGYDMEDAMIINKSAFERGFGHGTVYKTLLVDLTAEAERRKGPLGKTSLLCFGNKNTVMKPANNGAKNTADGPEYVAPMLGEDGLPSVGQKIGPGDPLWCAFVENCNEHIIGAHKDTENAYVDAIRFLGCNENRKDITQHRASITLRYPRRPVIGDKFSSRHGQKGVLSVLWPECDMPFCESGLTPDIIINPHAFPSRMTIGMLIESMAGKSAASCGRFHDGTPFAFQEHRKAVDFFGAFHSSVSSRSHFPGSQLCAAGYEYFGSEPVSIAAWRSRSIGIYNLDRFTRDYLVY
jgi:DNA-directed RNA polymerase I subunit RPA2